MPAEILTKEELNKISMWLPYRPDWPIVDRDIGDTESYYGNMITSLTINALFDTYYSQDGGMTNYLEFICYPKGNEDYDGNAIMVCVSCCAPIAAYGQTTFFKKVNSCGYNFIDSSMIGVVDDAQLKTIENEILKILSAADLTLIDKEFASKLLPEEIADNIKLENLNQGNQYLHCIFQYND